LHNGPAMVKRLSFIGMDDDVRKEMRKVWQDIHPVLSKRLEAFYVHTHRQPQLPRLTESTASAVSAVHEVSGAKQALEQQSKRLTLDIDHLLAKVRQHSPRGAAWASSSKLLGRVFFDTDTSPQIRHLGD
jgi:hypothetical protein